MDLPIIVDFLYHLTNVFTNCSMNIDELVFKLLEVTLVLVRKSLKFLLLGNQWTIGTVFKLLSWWKLSLWYITGNMQKWKIKYVKIHKCILNIRIGAVGFLNWWLSIDQYFVNIRFTGLYYWNLLHLSVIWQVHTYSSHKYWI